MYMMNTELISCRSHHEKLVIVDYKICYIGGIDLCFGRYDTPGHKVGDCPSVIWPGKDYYNPRYFFSYFYDLKRFFVNQCTVYVTTRKGPSSLT